MKRHIFDRLGAVVLMSFAVAGWAQLMPKMPAPAPAPVLAAPKPAPVPTAPAPAVITTPVMTAPAPVAPVLPAMPAIAPAVVLTPAPAEPVNKPSVAPAISGIAKSAPAEPVGKPVLVAPVLPAVGGIGTANATPGATASPATAAAPVGKGILLNPLATPSSKLGDAKMDVSNLKQQVDSSGLKTGAPERKGGLADIARDRPGQQLGENDKSSPSKFGDKSGLIGENVVKGADADTFGGERVNRGKTGDTRNFAGSGKGRASEGDPTTESAQDQATGGKGTIGDMLRMEGGTPTGNDQADAAELSYAQSVGSDGYAATKNMSQAERKSYWEGQRNKQLSGAGRPRDDDMGGGGPTLVGTPQMKQQQLKAIGKSIAAKKGAAGGSDDQRVEQGGSGGPMRQVVGQDDRPERSREAGTVNINKVLEINTKVNPTRQ